MHVLLHPIYDDRYRAAAAYCCKINKNNYRLTQNFLAYFAAILYVENIISPLCFSGFQNSFHAQILTSTLRKTKQKILFVCALTHSFYVHKTRYDFLSVCHAKMAEKRLDYQKIK